MQSGYKNYRNVFKTGFRVLLT